ncbi:membrane protein, partial [Morganella morganii]
MSEPIKSRIDFEEAPLSPPVQDIIKPAHQLRMMTAYSLNARNSRQNRRQTGKRKPCWIQALKPRRSLWR